MRSSIAPAFTGRSSGKYFDLQMNSKDGKRMLEIDNNASFRVRAGSIEFPDPPLWGVWTWENLKSHLRIILRSRRYLIPVRELQVLAPNVVCSSYASK